MTTAKKSVRTSRMAISGGKAISGSGKTVPVIKSVTASTKTVSVASKPVLEVSAEPTSAAASALATSGGKTTSGGKATLGPGKVAAPAPIATPAPATSGGKATSGSGKAAASAPVAAPLRRPRHAETTIPSNYTLPASAEIPRVSITEVAPVTEGARFPVKAAIGEASPVTATVLAEGRVQFGAGAVLLRPISPADRDEAGYDIYEPLSHVDDPTAWEVVDRAWIHEIRQGLNYSQAELQVETEGCYAFAVESWVDSYLTWVRDTGVKVVAGISVELMLEEDARPLERAITGKAPRPVGFAAAAQSSLADVDKTIP